MSDEKIVAAALRFTGLSLNGNPVPDLIVMTERPGRHHSAMHAFVAAGAPDAHGCDQGFVTSTGRFVERKEAGQIATAARQLIAQSSNDYLFSEDVW